MAVEFNRGQPDNSAILKQQEEMFNNFINNIKNLNRTAESEIYQIDNVRKQIDDKNAEILELTNARIRAEKTLKDESIALREEEQKELEELIRTFEDKREELQVSLESLEKEIKQIPKDKKITAGIKSSLEVIAKNLGSAVKGATANVKKVLDTNTDEYKKSVLDDIAELSKTEKGRIQAFKKLDDAITDIGFNIDEFSEFSEEFVDDFKKFQKNTRELEKAQSEARRMGVQAEIDIFEGKLTPLSKDQVRRKQDELKSIEKTIEENEKLIKRAAQAGDKDTIDKILEQNEKLFKESQKLADMGIKTRGMFEKSMFRPEFVDKIRARIEDATIFGKTLGERKGELGEFFDGITPAPIQDAFRGVFSAVSPVTAMFKEFLKPLKIFPFLFIKLSKLFQKQNKNVADNNKITEQENKIKKKGIKIQKAENDEKKVGILSKITDSFKNFGGKVTKFFTGLIAVLPTLIIGALALGAAFLLFQKVLKPVLQKLNLIADDDKPLDEMSNRELHEVNDANKKKLMQSIEKHAPGMIPGVTIGSKRISASDSEITRAAYKEDELVQMARDAGVPEEQIKLFQDQTAELRETQELKDERKIRERERQDMKVAKTSLDEYLSREIRFNELMMKKDSGQLLTQKEKGTFNRLREQLAGKDLTDVVSETKVLRDKFIKEQAEFLAADKAVKDREASISTIQSNIANSSVNNSFIPSSGSGDNFFMGGLVKPLLSGFGMSYN